MPGTSGPFGERRRSERHVVQDLQGTLRVSTDARILNLSMTGMAVETDAQLPVGRRYAITFRYAADTTLRLAGSVVWSRLRERSSDVDRGAKPAYDAGFRFDQTLGPRAADLARILQAAAVSEVSRRISGRFKIHVEQPVSLEASFEFATKNVSATGILVETVGFPPLDAPVDAELRCRELALRTRGRIARVHETVGDRGETLRQLGIDFTETSEEAREAIRIFVNRCAEQAPDEATG
jgi:hypothetical protein